jgi:hypothetical protein
MKHKRFAEASRWARTRAVATLAFVMLVYAACSGVQVRTLVAPDADISSRPTFRLMRAPKAPGNVQLSSNDPMLVNSITYRRIRDAIRQALEKRGYQYSEDSAAMLIAYYATAQPKLDIQTWNYGYGWRRFPREQTEVYQYEQGTVIIDAVDPVTREMLWRGQARAAVSEDPDKYAQQLEKAVQAIIAKFPARKPS